MTLSRVNGIVNIEVRKMVNYLNKVICHIGMTRLAARQEGKSGQLSPVPLGEWSLPFWTAFTTPR